MKWCTGRRWAIANSYAVFTHDLDFGTMLALSGADGPSVLQVRCLNVLPEAIGMLVLSLLKTYGTEIEQGALVVADERRQRVRIANFIVQVCASGSVHGCPSPSARGSGRKA